MEIRFSLSLSLSLSLSRVCVTRRRETSSDEKPKKKKPKKSDDDEIPWKKKNGRRRVAHFPFCLRYGKAHPLLRWCWPSKPAKTRYNPIGTWARPWYRVVPGLPGFYLVLLGFT